MSKNENQYPELPLKTPSTKIFWLNDKIVNLKIDPALSYSENIKCDSVIGVNYIGFSGEHFFNPINEKGKYINTISQRKKLNQSQILRLNSIIGNKKTYKNPNIAGCYEPRLAFIYFKNNAVICQTQVCLSCYQLQSTAHFVDGVDGNFNNQAQEKLTQLHDELSFTEN
ncbi:hypothetical protein EYY60_12655 [Flavobacterium zhairuonense]|uniref:hypothetical protein n=1 Tax=Flavobacterium zhairuonense TaxID=2493631 RepID=UPI001050D381|nr:hypothetical protein [Flavobacterium zhairuonense]KAF2509227.1 hypothetical protein EYY60_12655 [Flavobacterium zhairuonense]